MAVNAAAATSTSPTSPPPMPQRLAAPAVPQSAEQLHRQVEQLTTQLAEAHAALATERKQSEQWQRCVRELSNGMLLNGRMNAKYERRVANRLEAALSKLDKVESVKYINCSFPSVAADAPFLQLVKYDALDSSRWAVAWSPCWSVELCLEGHSFLVPFKLVIRLRSLRLRGELTATFPPDLAYAIVSFVEFPEVKFEVDSDVSVGAVPMPLKSAVSHKIRAELHKWMASRVVAPSAMRVNRKHEGAPKDQPTLQQVVLNGTIHSAASLAERHGSQTHSSVVVASSEVGSKSATGVTLEVKSPKVPVTDEQLQEAILAALDRANRSVPFKAAQPTSRRK